MISLWIFDAALAFSVFVHEAGHAMMAKWLGVRITKVRFGYGPLLLRIGVFDWRLVPISGEVQTVKEMTPWKGVTIALSGVLMQWVVVAIAMVTGIAHLNVTFWAWVLGFAVVGLLNWVPVWTTDGAVAWTWVRKGNFGGKRHLI